MMDAKALLSRFDPRRSEAQRWTTRQSVAASSALTGSYLAMNAAATVMAGLGLLQNSATVIIGAMLIAMLFGPIVGIALGLAEGELPLLGRSLVSEIAGAAWVLGIGFGVGIASRTLPIGSEILSRTSPSLLDLSIGLVGGLAGGFTYVSGGLPEVIVGVAIGTSLVPPLTSCGILLAHHLPELAAGAFLLFLANFSAIAIGAMTVFWVAGHRPRVAGLTRLVLLPRLISFALLAILVFHFAVTFRRTVAQSRLESGVRKTVSRAIASLPGARLVTVEFATLNGEAVAWLVVRTPQPISPGQVARLNDMVDRAVGSTVALHVRSVITAESTREGYLFKPQNLPTEDPGQP
jgi:uncharacterized hydrophobic protein (TIGR00271 family)